MLSSNTLWNLFLLSLFTITTLVQVTILLYLDSEFPISHYKITVLFFFFFDKNMNLVLILSDQIPFHTFSLFWDKNSKFCLELIGT